MYTPEVKKLLDREDVYAMLTKEDQYASGWGDGKDIPTNEFPSHLVDEFTGQPFSMMDFMVFAEKYLDEAKLVWGNYTPDPGAVRIRLIKAASLLVSALQVYGEGADWARLAGVSSSKFPILHGGLVVKTTAEKE